MFFNNNNIQKQYIMKTYHILLILLFSISSMSCSSDLSRSSARKIILNDIQTSEKTIDIVLQRQHDLGYHLGSRFLWNQQSAEQQLMDHGFIRFRRLYYLVRYFDYTDKIMRHINNERSNPPHYYWFKIAELKDVEITGILGEKNHRRVECVLIYEPNEIGNILLDESDLRKKKTFNFSKYDDGWRLN